MAPASRNPLTWDEYHGRASPSGSMTSSVLAEEQALIDGSDDGANNNNNYNNNGNTSHNATGRRRSSVTNRLAAVADIGGVNSFRSFARSWHRAADYHEVIPRRPSFVLAGADQEHLHHHHALSNEGSSFQYGRSPIAPARAQPQSGLLGQHLNASPPQGIPNGASAAGPSGSGTAHDDRESKSYDAESAALLGSSPSRSSIFAVPPHLATPPLIGSYGSAYGTLGSVGGTLRHRPSIGQASSIWDAEEAADDDDGTQEGAAFGEHQPILVKEVKQGDKVVLAVEGQSTLPQSVFNSINAIIGVGLLSLPLALNISGWIIGLVLLTLTAAVTSHTAKLLSKCMDYDASLITYSDLAYISFGPRARVVVSALFTLELVSACVALVILFSDSLDLLLPGVANGTFWKCVAAVLVLMLNAMPLRLLSYTSVIGIFSTFCIVLIVIVDGLVKEHTPGSLREPATTYLWPSSWLALPLAYGLLASPWGAHSVFPSIYRDMRHPYKWGKAVNVTFSFSYVLDTCLAIIGVLMFGDGIRDAITSNLLRTPGYPKALTILMCVFIAIIPLTKIPLNARPIITTADVLCGIHHHHHGNLPPNRTSALYTSVVKGLVRVSVVLVLLVISIVFPAFDSVCAFLGAALCTLISIILPISFYLKLFWSDVSLRERITLFLTLAVFSILGTLGTIWTFLPKHLIGAD